MEDVEKGGIPLKEKVSATGNGNNGLLLYSYHHCFYTQKVLMALYEKKIPFTTKLVDITKKEQFHLWYLKINPRGEVPVLKDGIKCIPDSEMIVQYLEDNFSNGGHSRLIPIDQGPEIKQKVIKYNADIENIPVSVITLGSLFNNELCSNIKYPFFLPSVQNLLKASEKSGSNTVRNVAKEIPEFSETLLQKAQNLDQRRVQITDKNEFLKVLQQVDDFLTKVEDELSAHKDDPDWWLCTNRFTIADISLAILLDRLSKLGLEDHFWGKGKRPNVDKYYRRVQKRDSFKKTIPSFMTDLSIFIRNKAPLILGVSLLTVITVVIGGFIYFKK